MGLSDILKNFLKSEETLKSITLNISETKIKANEAYKEKQKDFEPQVFSKISEIKHELKEIEVLLKHLSDEEYDSDASKRFEKVVEASKKRTAIQLTSLIEKIAPSKVMGLGTAENEAENSLKIIQKDMLKIWKNIAYTGTGHKNTMKEIGNRLESIRNANTQILQTLRGKEISALRALLMEIKRAEEFPKKESTLKSEIVVFEKRLESHQDERELLNRKKTKLEESEEVKNYKNTKKQVDKLKSELDQLSIKLNSTVGVMEKPLRKLRKMVELSKAAYNTTNHTEVIEFLKGPMHIIKADPKGIPFKNIALELEEKIRNGELEIKEKERDKKLDAFREISSIDFFTDYFWNENQIKKKLEQLEKQIKNFTIKQDLENLNEKIKKERISCDDLHKNIFAKKEELKKLQESQERLESNIKDLWKRAFNETLTLS